MCALSIGVTHSHTIIIKMTASQPSADNNPDGPSPPGLIPSLQATESMVSIKKKEELRIPRMTEL